MDRNILRACREDPRRTSTDIQVSVTSPNEPVSSRRTIRRRLQVAGLHGRRPVKKPLVSLKNRKARVKWAKQHLSWGPREYAPQYQCPMVKHGGGSVMVWGCFSDTSMGPLKRIVGTMNRYVYEDILKNTMRPWARENLCRSWVFQQDNDPKNFGSCRQLVSTSPCGSPGMAKSVSGLESHRTYVGGARTTSQRSPMPTINSLNSKLLGRVSR
uniref:HTH_Tnp_Tc3_2 domain-containing protein n=1 Tax=Caenorhabditis japonica TaxID=281687 RepID=A0A8R1I9E5_CAEJA